MTFKMSHDRFLCLLAYISKMFLRIERTLKERTDEHLRDVRQQAEKPIMRHFEGHKEEQLRVTILQRMFQEGRIYRQLAEEQWIMKLKTKIPQGCNVKLN